MEKVKNYEEIKREVVRVETIIKKTISIAECKPPKIKFDGGEDLGDIGNKILLSLVIQSWRLLAPKIVDLMSRQKCEAKIELFEAIGEQQRKLDEESRLYNEMVNTLKKIGE